MTESARAVLRAACLTLAFLGMLLAPWRSPAVAAAGGPGSIGVRQTAATASMTGTVLLAEGFSAAASAPNAWTAYGDACLTAATAATPATSVHGCGTSAPHDPIGQGALQLTTGGPWRTGTIVAQTPVSTANGLQITFTDYAFAGSATGADGLALFLSDGSKPAPSPGSQSGGALNYAGDATHPGMANAYVGIAFDEFGSFSNPEGHLTGGVGLVPETIAVRGAAAGLWPYLGGVRNAAGQPASLPFSLDSPAAATRPANAPTVRVTLSPAGMLGIAIDRHDGAGFVTRLGGSIVGIAGQPAVPARVYVGLSAGTGGAWNRHQISGFTVATLTPPVAPALQTETFLTAASSPNLWTGFGDACLTAGNATTPGSSLPACGARAPVDAVGGGALQLTAAGTYRFGMAVLHAALPTAGGLQITFTDAAFGGTSPGADGLAFFLTDAAKPLPAAPASPGGALGCASKFGVAGLANLYLCVALDEYGNFSNPGDGRNGGPGVIPERIAARGSAQTGWQYLGGTTSAGGAPARLPFGLDFPATPARPGAAPTIRAILTPAGVLTVAIDRHDGNGFATYYSQTIVGVGGQPAVPAYVYFGVSAATGKYWNRHQISNLTIANAALPPATPALQNPPQLVSSNGTLVFNLGVRADPVTGRPQFSYNGSAVPPTLRVLPGDALVVNLTNSLPAPPNNVDVDYTNSANLHYHGLHVSPQAPGDDSIDMLAAPGQSLHYTLTIPADHPPGLYWYHTHAHGEAERQTLAGLSGALIVDGIAAYTPQVANMAERVLVVRDAPLPGATLPDANRVQVRAMKWAMQHGVAMHAAGSTMRAMPGMPADRTELHAASTDLTRNPYVAVDRNYRSFVRPSATSTHCVAGTLESPVKALTLNGQTQPSLAIAPGEQQFWRLVNAGADTYLDVAVDNTIMQIVGIDGVPISSGIGTPAVLAVTHWVLPPASRVEFIVTGPPAGAPAYLRTNCFDAGQAGAAMPATILASLDPGNATAAAQAARRSASRVVARIAPRAQRFTFHVAPRVHSAAAIRGTAVSATRTIYYTDQNNINGIAYDPAAPPQFYAQSGTVEEWTIRNSSLQVHTFHIHQVHFVVEAIDGVTQAQQYVADNINVPAANANGPGTVKLLLDFTDPAIVGTFLLHCHILSHEDAGMMAKIRIGTSPPLKLSSSNVAFSGPTAGLQTVTVTGGLPQYSVTGCGGVARAAVTGNVMSLLPTAAGACVITVADASNPSITAALGVAVGPPPPVLTLLPNTVSFSAPGATAQSVSIHGGTAPFASAGCATVAGATVSGAAVNVSPLETGTCSLAVTDAAGNSAALPVTVNGPTGANVSDDLTFHQNAQRTGWYAHETALTVASVGSNQFGQIGSLVAPAGARAMGKVYAQPLFVTNEATTDGKRHNLIVVATANDQLFAFDETTRAVVWRRDFTNLTAGIRQQLWTDSACADVNPDVGIIGTPVIDRARDTLYVVVATMENGTPFMRLHALSLAGGNDAIAPAVVGGSVALATGGIASVSPLGNMNRAALLEANGTIYVGLGSHCDQNAATVHGWVMGYSAATLAQTANLVDVSNANDGSGFYLGAVWMSGFGPAADVTGNVYFATGNGSYNGSSNFSMSILKVPGNLNLAAASTFTPFQAAADAAVDDDLGSGGVVVLPDLPGAFPHLLLAGGKCSANNVGCFKYLLNRDALGGQRAGNAGALWAGSTGGFLLGGPAYFADATGAQHVVFGSGQPLSTYTLGVAPIGLTVESAAYVGCLECRDQGSQPIVSSNGTQPGSAVVWALKTPGNNGGAIALYAFDALHMNQTLFAAPANVWTQAPQTSYVGGALISPLVADGRVYVPGDGAVTVFGLH